MEDKDEPVTLVRPKPYEKLGSRFVISGWIPKSWLHIKTCTGLGYCLVDKDCIEFSCGNIHVKCGWLTRFRKKILFSKVVELNSSNAAFVSKSQGRIVIGLDGQYENQLFYVPVIIKGFGVNDEINEDKLAEKHLNIVKTLLKYKADLRTYNQKLQKIRENNLYKIPPAKTDSRDLKIDLNVADKKVSENILSGLKITRDLNIDLHDLGKQKREEDELNEQYEDALRWRGPLFGGPEYLDFALYAASLFVGWTLSHILQDLDAIAWDKLKEIFKKVFIPIKQSDDVEKKVALVIKEAKKKTIIFVFSDIPTMQELDRAFMEIINTLKSLDQAMLSRETHTPLVFVFNNSDRRWEQMETKNSLSK